MTVDGRIRESNGKYLKLEITVTDTVGRTWIEGQEFEGVADTRAYKDGYNAGRDPFDFRLSANDRVKFALGCLLGEIRAELIYQRRRFA